MSNQPTVYVTLVKDRRGNIEAHDGVWGNRDDAIDEAEQYADHYHLTLTDAGLIDLRDEFSDRYKRAAAKDAWMDSQIDKYKGDVDFAPIRSYTLHERA